MLSSDRLDGMFAVLDGMFAVPTLSTRSTEAFVAWTATHILAAGQQICCRCVDNAIGYW